jgi:hypothetical protein
VKAGDASYIRYFDYMSYSESCIHYITKYRESNQPTYSDLILNSDDFLTLQSSEHISSRAISKADIAFIRQEVAKLIKENPELSIAVLVDASVKHRDSALLLDLHNGLVDAKALLTHNFQPPTPSPAFQKLLAPIPMDTELDFISNCLPNLKIGGHKINNHISLYKNWRLQSAKRRFLVSFGLDSIEDIFDRAIGRVETKDIEPVVRRRKRYRLSEVNVSDTRDIGECDFMEMNTDSLCHGPMASVNSFLANFRSDLIRFGRCILLEDYRGEVAVLWNASNAEDCAIISSQFVTTTFSRTSQLDDSCDNCSVFRSSCAHEKVL